MRTVADRRAPLNRNAVPIQGARFFYMWTGVQKGAREATLRTPPPLDHAGGLRRELVVNAANTGDLVLLQPLDMTKELPLCHIPHLRERLLDQLVECLALLSRVDTAHNRFSHDVAILVDHVGGRERV